MGNRYDGSLPTPGVTENWGSGLNDIIDDLDEGFDSRNTADGGVGHAHTGVDGEGPLIRPDGLQGDAGAGESLQASESPDDGIVTFDSGNNYFQGRKLIAGTNIEFSPGSPWTGSAGDLTVSVDTKLPPAVLAAAQISTTGTLSVNLPLSGFCRIVNNGSSTVTVGLPAGADTAYGYNILVAGRCTSSGVIQFREADGWQVDGADVISSVSGPTNTLWQVGGAFIASTWVWFVHKLVNTT